MLPAYVIHSKSLPERAGHIRHELDRVGIPFEWILDFEVDEITPEVDALYFAKGAPLSIRQKSCALKHIVAMQRICKQQHDLALIFEDDAQLVPDFIARLRRVLAEAERWPRPRILHLGAATNFYTPAAQLKPDQSVYAGNRVRNMEAYVLGAPEAAARLDWIARHPMHEPIDIAFNRGDPAMGIPFLWTEPPLAEQGSLNGAFRSSLACKNHSQTRLRIQFTFQKLSRRHLKRWLHRWIS
ncbi:glycosyltransferase family 25 protein [Bradyrhizobium sp. BR13661]|jgi:glycosyl transferase family 25|uniref:glycosyltransferase family 25 protein n=1 Tax=Bradyrhizobium sp. BR13661 TaxID=2940622 RepID=UPI00247404BD|nr:glycosyltransferase family 25 protein [Bradyrhizobium sp. BR13661]MDH6263327.1 glycosyl transferase family 25 [Bradyrhizobium sp. BR13661]